VNALTRIALAGTLAVVCSGTWAQAPNYDFDPTHTFVNYVNGH
jgi:hypothetical protein